LLPKRSDAEINAKTVPARTFSAKMLIFQDNPFRIKALSQLARVQPLPGAGNFCRGFTAH
jgi:hypothetical protein